MKNKLLLLALRGAFLLILIELLSNLLFSLPTFQGLDYLSIISKYIAALLIGYYILNTHLKGIRLIIAVFLIYFAIGQFNILIEAYIFNVTDRDETSLQLLMGLLNSIIFCPLYYYIIKNQKNLSVPNFIPRTWFSWSWRVLVGNIMYLFFYVGAGLTLSIVYPQIMEFYEGKIPPLDVIIKTQIYLRGFVFVGIAVLIGYSMPLSIAKKAVLTGLIFSLLGGIIPLLSPNELMPAFVRFGHGFEVGISNFLYGLTLTYLIAPRIK